jgi:hypothetical protein
MSESTDKSSVGIDPKSYRFAPVSAHIYQAVLVGMWIIPALIIALSFRSPIRWILLGAAVLTVGAGVARGFRLALCFGASEIIVRNYLRTYRFQWSEVAAIGTGAVLIRPTLAFIFHNGTVRSAEVTQEGRRRRDQVRSELRNYAPRTVRFLEESHDVTRVDRCPRCGESTLAPDTESRGIRHCWGCGAEISREAVSDN